MTDEQLFKTIQRYLLKNCVVRKEDDVNLSSHIIADLGMDSLDLADLLISLSSYYPQTNIDSIYGDIRLEDCEWHDITIRQLIMKFNP